MTQQDENILQEMEEEITWTETQENIADEKNKQDAQQEIASLNEKLLRALSDQQNMAKRMERERQEMGLYITQGVACKFLPIVDNMERAIAALPEDIATNPWIDGIKSIYANMLKQLEALWIKPFESIGCTVDVSRHEVISQGPGKKDTIVLEFEKGYLIFDQVLRPAKVVVGNDEAQ